MCAAFDACLACTFFEGLRNVQHQVAFIKQLAKATSVGLRHMCSSSPVLGTILSGQVALVSGGLAECLLACKRHHLDETARLQVATAVAEAGEEEPAWQVNQP